MASHSRGTQLDLFRHATEGASTPSDTAAYATIAPLRPSRRRRQIVSATRPPLVHSSLDDPISPNTTGSVPSFDRFLASRLQAMVRGAQDERFEIGVSSAFSRGVVAMIETYGNIAVACIETLLESPHTNADTAAEILRWLPFVREVDSYKYRLSLLRKGLASPRVQIRDAAAMALAYLADASTLDAIETALEREQCRELREDLSMLRETLDQSARAGVSQADQSK